MAYQRKSESWLEQTLVELLDQAKGQTDPSIPECTKLAELLFKIIVRNKASTGTEGDDLADLRKRLIEGKAHVDDAD